MILSILAIAIQTTPLPAGVVPDIMLRADERFKEGCDVASTQDKASHLTCVCMKEELKKLNDPIVYAHYAEVATARIIYGILPTPSKAEAASTKRLAAYGITPAMLASDHLEDKISPIMSKCRHYTVITPETNYDPRFPVYRKPSNK